MNCKRCGNELLVGDQNCKICGDLSNVQNNYYQSQNNNIVYNQCKLTLIRKKSIVGSFITFNVYIDKVKVGKIKNGQTLELNIAMGQHKISINKKNEIDIIVNGNTEAELALIGVDNFGLINIDKQNLQFVDNKTCINYIEKNKNQQIVFLQLVLFFQ